MFRRRFPTYGANYRSPLIAGIVAIERARPALRRRPSRIDSTIAPSHPPSPNYACFHRILHVPARTHQPSSQGKCRFSTVMNGKCRLPRCSAITDSCERNAAAFEFEAKAAPRPCWWWQRRAHPPRSAARLPSSSEAILAGLPSQWTTALSVMKRTPKPGKCAAQRRVHRHALQFLADQRVRRDERHLMAVLRKLPGRAASFPVAAVVEQDDAFARPCLARHDGFSRQDMARRPECCRTAAARAGRRRREAANRSR